MYRTLSVIRSAQCWLLGALMLAMSFAYTLNVAVRSVAPDLAPHLAWIDEICLFGLVWMVFLGLSLGLESGRQIGMRLLLARWPASPRKVAKFMINALGLVFCLYLTKIGVDITLFVARSGQMSPTLNISMAWLYCVMPVGFVLLALSYLLEIVTKADRFEIELDPTHHL